MVMVMFIVPTDYASALESSMEGFGLTSKRLMNIILLTSLTFASEAGWQSDASGAPVDSGDDNDDV